MKPVITACTKHALQKEGGQARESNAEERAGGGRGLETKENEKRRQINVG